MSAATFRVKHYQAAARGVKPGVRVAYFATQAEAEAYAADKRLYAKPAVVAIVEPLNAEQQVIANRVHFGVAV